MPPSRSHSPSSELSTLPENIRNSRPYREEVWKSANRIVDGYVRSGKLRPVKPVKDGGRYIPRVDLLDDPASAKLTAVFELPGIKTGDIALHMREGRLFVTGQRRSPFPQDIVQPRHAPLPIDPISAADSLVAGELGANISPSVVKMPVHELCYGTFHRSIKMPEGMKESEITAALADGMLTVSWPRSPVNAPAPDASRSESKSGTVTPLSSSATAAATSQ